MGRLRPTRLFFRLAGWFLVIALIPLAGMGYAAYVAYRDAITQSIARSLNHFALVRSRQVEGAIGEQLRVARALTTLPSVRRKLDSGSGDPTAQTPAVLGPNLAEALRTVSLLYLGSRQGLNVALIRPDGRVAYDTTGRMPEGTDVRNLSGRDAPLIEAFDDALREPVVHLSPVSGASGGGPLTAYITAQVRQRGRLLGVVALEVNWRAVILALSPHIGLGRTGEAYLATRVGDSLRYLSPLRYAGSAPPTDLPLGAPVAQAMQKAITGNRGLGVTIDYRGVPVVAAWRPLPHLNWGLVVEIDVAEAFQPIATLRGWALLLGLLSALGAAAAAVWVARSFARPLEDLTAVTRRFAAGDLTARTNVRTRDELGTLARSFDGMADSLAESRSRLERTIEELRAKNEALSESETRFRQLAENIDVAFWIYEFEEPYGHSYMSPAWERISGVPIAKVMADPYAWLEAIHPDDQPGILEDWQRAERESVESLFRMRRPDGSIRWIRGRSFPLRDDQGRVRRLAGIAEDVTEQRRAQEALRESEEMFRRLAETTRLVPWELDPDTLRFTYVGPQAEQLLGHPVEDWLAPDFWLDHIHPEDRETTAAVSARAARSEDKYEFEYRMLAADGRVVWVHELVTVVRDAGERIRLRGFLIDVTDRKLAEDAREELLRHSREAQRRAEEGSRLKNEFLATVSHELRTPLNAILGWSQVLEEGGIDDDTLRRAISTIARNARSQAQLIDDLLDVSRIITGRLRLETRPVTDLPAIVDAAISTLRLAADAKRITVHLALDQRPGPVLGDPARLQQVVWNLVSNAIKFTPAGGEVHVVLENRGSHVHLAVSDTGEGIEPDFLPYVFDRFRQGDGGSTRIHGGLGLGLAIVRQLVELHGGEVSAESPGRGMGARFDVRLPCMRAEIGVSRDDARSGTPDSGEIDSALEGLRVVAVDDEPDSLDLIRTVLERSRVRVATARSATEALRRLSAQKTDLLIADIGMPERDGVWLIRQVRALDPGNGGSVPALALTAYARAEDRERILAAGFQVHLAKPVSPADLTRAVAALARRAADERDAGA